MCTRTLSSNTITIRLIAQLLGKFSSSFLAVPRGKLHYRALERYKTESLRYHKGNYNRTVSLSEPARLDILWWKNNITGSWAPIMRGNPVHIMTTDASTLGWGAVLRKTATGGQFTLEEKESHINVLELKAVLFGLQALCCNLVGTHILIKVDNTSAVSSINKMGSTKSLAMDRVVQEIWKYAIERRLWLTVTHIPGILNVEADKKSRNTETRTEWMLNKKVFQDTITNLNFQPTVDLFASRINTQLENFIHSDLILNVMELLHSLQIGMKSGFMPSHRLPVSQERSKRFTTIKQ